MSKVFAFNLGEEMEDFEVSGRYDPAQQLWVGDSGVVAYTAMRTNTGGYTLTGTYTNGDLDHDRDTDDVDWDTQRD